MGMDDRPNPTRILVTGGDGMLGKAFAEEQVHFPRFELRSCSHRTLDVRDAKAVDAWADWIEGGWIVHCAALVDVEGCARDPDLARETIVEGTRHVTALARKVGARLFYPQSFLIYDGADDLIAEDIEPNPLHLYGQLKFEAEQIVVDADKASLAVRMAGFFGGGDKDKNFVGRIIPAIEAAIVRGDRSFAVGDRVWQPTWTKDLAFNSLDLMARGASGKYQMGSLGAASFADIAEIIVEELGWSDRVSIERVSAATIAESELGQRPNRAILSCERLNREQANLQRCWRATLRCYLADPYFDRFRFTQRTA